MRTTIAILFLASISVFCTAQVDMEKDIPSIKVRGKQMIYTIAENMPMFPDSSCLNSPRISDNLNCSNGKLNRYINENVVYPDSAMGKNIQGILVLSFIVMPDGQIDSISVIRDNSAPWGYFAQEGLRLMNKMIREKGPWFPGSQNGQNVAVRMNLPIRFKLRH